MSSNIYKIQVVAGRNKTLGVEFTDALKACVASGGNMSGYPGLLAVFRPWSEAFLISVADLESGIEVALDCSSTSMWSVDILGELVELGAAFVGIEAYYDQVDAEQAFYYKGLERVSESDFPKVKYRGVECEINALLKKNKDKELVKRVKEGLNPHLVIEGESLLHLSVDYQLSKLPYVLLDSGANFKLALAQGKGNSIFSTILFRHGEEGRSRLIEALVRDGFDLNARRSYTSPLVGVASAAAAHEDALPLLDLTLRLGADVNAHIYGEEGGEQPGNLLFNTSMYRGKYQQQVHEKLVAAGARVVPGRNLSDETKAQRLLDREAAAETVAELAAAGFDFNLKMDRRPFIFSALSTDLKLALQVMDHIDMARLVENSPARLLCQICQCVNYQEGSLADAEEIIRRCEKAGLKPSGHAVDSEYHASIGDYFPLHSLPDRPMRAEQPPYSISDLVKAIGLDEYRWA